MAPPGLRPRGFVLSWGSNVNRTAFLVDGFNLYHSQRECERATGKSLFWLDVAGLCASFLHALPGRSELAEVGYFSALAHHRESTHPGTVARQVDYFAALQSTGVHVELGQFKPRTAVCPGCGARFVRWEEKETDVAIGTRLAELACGHTCDTLAVVSGDTDLVPALRVARRLAPRKLLVVLQPFRRVNRELSRHADRSLTIGVRSYVRHQFATGLQST